jgi:RNA polymerase subunit RPABC4/transcription elongation factor Spt4
MSKASKMVTCKHCGTEIAASAKVCPKCGGKNKKPIYKRPWFIALIVIIIIGAIGSAGGDKTSNEAGNNDTQVTTSK